MKDILRIYFGFSKYQWFRKWYGGVWGYTHVDLPVCSSMWLPVPDYAADMEDYREPLWRCKTVIEDYRLYKCLNCKKKHSCRWNSYCSKECLEKYIFGEI